MKHKPPYDLITGPNEEPVFVDADGNWMNPSDVLVILNGLRPEERLIAVYRAALERIARHPVRTPIMGRPSMGLEGFPACQDIAEEALMYPNVSSQEGEKHG